MLEHEAVLVETQDRHAGQRRGPALDGSDRCPVLNRGSTVGGDDGLGEGRHSRTFLRERLLRVASCALLPGEWLPEGV